MNQESSPSDAERAAHRFCSLTLSQIETWSRSVLRVAAEPCIASDTGRLQSENDLFRWAVCPLPIPAHGIMGMMVRLTLVSRMGFEEYRGDRAATPFLPTETLSLVARRMVSWLRHPLFAEAVAETWRRAARAESPMGYHVSCDSDGYAYAISIRSIPAQGGKKPEAAVELLVMNRLHPCWCAEALQEVDGERRPRFCPGTESLFYRPCQLV